MSSNELVEQFQAVTGASTEEATHLLEACESNLEAAVNLFLQAKPSTSTQDTSTNSTNGVIDIEGDDGVRAPIPQSSGVLVPESYGNSYGPRQRRANTGSVFDRFRDFKAEGQAQYDMLREKSAKKDAVEKRKNLESLFRPPLDLIHPGSWDEAKSGEKWLLVNVQNSQEFSCQALNRDVWSNAAVKDLVKSNFFFWQTFHDSADGQRFQSYYHVKRFPFIGILDPRTGEMVLRIKATDPMTFCDAMTSFLESHPTFDSLDQKFTSSVTASPPLDEEEEACKPSYTRPSIKRKRVVLTNGTDEDSDEEQGSSFKRPSLDPLDTNGEESIQKLNLNDEEKLTTDSYKKYLGTSGAEVKLLFRFPNGSKEQLSIPLSSQLKALFVFVEARGYPVDDFDLVLAYPIRILTEKPAMTLLSDLSLNTQETVNVGRK